jgi:hypothetical protein
MQLELATRKRAKIKMALQGPSGSGKTMGALLVAYGLCGNWNKIAVIDTENYSASLYAHLGMFKVLNIGVPFSPEKYMEALKVCEQAGIDVIVIDSISHEWEGSGGILDIHSNMTGNSFTAWGKLTPRHNAFVQGILQSPAHIIGTIRSKQEYVLSERNGKQVPEKVGMKGVTRDGMDYEFTLVLDLDIKHNANASKDRTGLFMDKPHFNLKPSVGEQILRWCMEGETPAMPDQFLKSIQACNTLEELKSLYWKNPTLQVTYGAHFNKRKKELTPLVSIEQQSSPKTQSNGTGTSQ